MFPLHNVVRGKHIPRTCLIRLSLLPLSLSRAIAGSQAGAEARRKAGTPVRLEGGYGPAGTRVSHAFPG